MAYTKESTDVKTTTTLPIKTVPLQPAPVPVSVRPLQTATPTIVPLQPAPAPVNQQPPLMPPPAPNANIIQPVTKEPSLEMLGSFGQGTVMPGPERMTDMGTGTAPWLPDPRFQVIRPGQNITDSPTQGDPIPTGGYGGGNKTGGTGTGGGGAGGGTTTGGKPQSAQDIFNALLGGPSFEYDPFSDPEYQNAAAQLENQIVQQMVGRGMLDSSIARDRIQQGMTQLQDQFRVRAYERWTAERDFMMDMTGFAMRLEERDYNRWRDEQQMAIERQNANAMSAYANAELESANFEKMLARWTASGTADNTVANYFGVKPGTASSNPYALQQIEAMRTRVDSQMTSASKLAMSSTNTQLKMAFIEQARLEADAAQKAATGEPPKEITNEDILSATLPDLFATSQDPTWSATAYWQYINQIKGATSYDELYLATTQALSNPAMFIDRMGPYLYMRFSNDATEAANKRGDQLSPKPE